MMSSHISIAFNAYHRFITSSEHTITCMCLQTFLRMTNPCLTKIAYRSNHIQPGCIYTQMFNNSVATHAFNLSTLGSHNYFLSRLTKITKCSVFLLSITLISCHIGITRKLGNVGYCKFSSLDLFLSLLLLLSLLGSPCLPLRHLFLC